MWRVAPSLGAGAAALILTAGAPATPRGRGRVLFAPRFPRSGLITNEYAYWNPQDRRARRSRAWEMDSGSLFARDGYGYTGTPDVCNPDRFSRTCTDSAIFRLVTRRRNFDDVRVSFRLRMLRLVSTSATPAVPWDGVHIWLRYRSQHELYYASVARRDGHIDIKKKCLGGPDNGGTYHYLADRTGFPIKIGAWREVGADVRDEPDGSVRLRLLLGGRVLLVAYDRGIGCPPLRGPGGIGIRGDNAEFLFGSFTARSLS